MTDVRGSLTYPSSDVQWKIEKYSSIRKNKGESILSPEFEAGTNKGKWWIVLYPEGSSKATDGHISIFIGNKTIQSCSTSYEVSILNKSREKKFVMKGVWQDFTKGWGRFDFVKKDALLDRDNELLNEDTLTVNVLLELEDTSAPPVIESDSQSLTSDLLKLFNTSQMSDVEIRVKDRTFKAHKLILSARSSVFAAMFSHGMKENETNVVDIVDTEPEVLEVVLQYIYSGKCDHLEDMCHSILPVADKYCLDNLKTLCESELIWQLSSENAILSLELADAHRLIHLKKKCLNKICDTADIILESPEWERLSTVNKDLALEAMKAVFFKLRPKVQTANNG